VILLALSTTGFSSTLFGLGLVSLSFSLSFFPFAGAAPFEPPFFYFGLGLLDFAFGLSAFSTFYVFFGGM